MGHRINSVLAPQSLPSKEKEGGARKKEKKEKEGGKRAPSLKYVTVFRLTTTLGSTPTIYNRSNAISLICPPCILMGKIPKVLLILKRKVSYVMSLPCLCKHTLHMLSVAKEASKPALLVGSSERSHWFSRVVRDLPKCTQLALNCTHTLFFSHAASLYPGRMGQKADSVFVL